jgi:hypothetical protein
MSPVAGSSCGTPAVGDCDIYIGLDRGMTFTDRQFPWTPGAEIYYPIRDMSVPENLTTYRKLINWTLEQLEGGAKVHVGCIGGHGRTGMFFAALVAVATGRKDAITYVREHYCKKACETAGQIEFLVKHFGVDPVKASKSATSSKGGWTKDGNKVNGGTDAWPDDVYWIDGKTTADGKAIVPLVSSTTIWGDTLYGDETDV